MVHVLFHPFERSHNYIHYETWLLCGETHEKIVKLSQMAMSPEAASELFFGMKTSLYVPVSTDRVQQVKNLEQLADALSRAWETTSGCRAARTSAPLTWAINICNAISKNSASYVTDETLDLIHLAEDITKEWLVDLLTLEELKR